MDYAGIKNVEFPLDREFKADVANRLAMIVHTVKLSEDDHKKLFAAYEVLMRLTVPPR